MRNRSFCEFCIKNYIGTQGEAGRQKKIFKNPRQFMLLTFLRRRSLCRSYSVWLCGLYYGASCLVLLCFCPRVSSVLLALCSPRLGKRELVCVLLVQLFLYFASINFCPFSLPLGVRVGCGF